MSGKARRGALLAAAVGLLTVAGGASAAAPTAVTGPVASFAATSAKVTGTVSPNGEATSWYFEYGPTTAYGTRTPTQSAAAGTKPVNVSATLSGLTGGATYHYRLVATNPSGTATGGDRSFTLGGAPVVTTSPATGVTASTAKLNGSVNPNGRATTWYFEYGRTTAYGTRTDTKSAGSGKNLAGASVTVSGLAPAATYHFRLVATNSAGTVAGEDQAFSTLGPPVVETGPAQAVAATSATLTGSVNPSGRGTSWYFEYGPTTAYGTKTAAKNAGNGTTPVPVSAAIDKLTPGATYHYRLVATSNLGTGRGADRTLATPGAAVTIRASRRIVVYGRFTVLSGTVPNGQVGQQVTVRAQRFGRSGFTIVGTALTGTGGAWTLTVKPVIRTVYQASASGAVPGQLVIGVRPAIALRRITGGRLWTRVAAARSFAGRKVQLQRRAAGRWVTVRGAVLNRRSVATFRVALLPRGRSTVRVKMTVNQAGPGYLAGFSRTLLVRR